METHFQALFARIRAMIQDTIELIQLLEKWGLALEDGLKKNTSSFLKDLSYTVETGRGLKSM